MFVITERDTLHTLEKISIKFPENFCRFRIREKTCDELVNRHRRLVIRHDDSNEDDEDFDDFSDIEPELVQLNHRGRGLSDTGKHYIQYWKCTINHKYLTLFAFSYFLSTISSNKVGSKL